MARRPGGPGLLAVALSGCLFVGCVLAEGGACADGAQASQGVASQGVASQGVTSPRVTLTTEPSAVPATIEAPAAPPATAPAATTPPQTTPPQTAPANPVVPATSPATAVDSTSSLVWILIVIVGGLTLLGLIAWLVSASSRRTNARAAWQSRRLSAYAEGAALHDAIMAEQSQPGRFARLGTGEEAARWTDIQRRADNFSQRLYQLRDMAPDEDGQTLIEGALASLHALRSAVDVERSTGTRAGMTAEITRIRLEDFRVALDALRGD